MEDKKQKLAGFSKANITERQRLNEEKQEATGIWIENQNYRHDEDYDDLESITESSVVESSDSDDESYTSNLDYDTGTSTSLGTSTNADPNHILNPIIQIIGELLNSEKIKKQGNPVVDNTSDLHIGNVININGNIQINTNSRKDNEQRSKQKPNNKKSWHTKKDQSNSKKEQNIMEEEKEECVGKDAFIDKLKFTIPKALCPIKPRHTWLAQSPMEEVHQLEIPVEFVVISHTATECSEKQAINIRTIRDIQCFHIESRGWNDIAYNFLVGCDGNVYEGRSWNVIGAHTLGYNTRSIGISFIGCFMKELPSQSALNACKNLLVRGVEEGYITKNYKLVGHCQCVSTESPGRKLYEEIQTWDNFSTM